MERAARLIKQSTSSRSLFTDEDLFRALWPAAVGKAIAAHTLRLKLVRNALVVEMEDAIWQKQLYPLSSQIVSRLRKVSGSEMVHSVEFRVGIARRDVARSSVLNQRTVTAPLFLDEADSIQDPVLKKVYRLSRKKATA